MTTELNLTRVPATVMALLAGEACRHNRSLEQEVLVLLTEALHARVHAGHPSRAEIDEIVQRFDQLPNRDTRLLAELIEYDSLGLPK